MGVSTVAIVCTGGVAIAAGAGSAAVASSGVAVGVAGGTATAGGAAGAAGTIGTIVSNAAGPLVSAGPWGWAVLAADEDFNCWRAVLHDYETAPAEHGLPLKDVATDPRVVGCRAETREGYWPQFWLRNKWDEEFRIDYVLYPDGGHAAHATKI